METASRMRGAVFLCMGNSFAERFEQLKGFPFRINEFSAPQKPGRDTLHPLAGGGLSPIRPKNRRLHRDFPILAPQFVSVLRDCSYSWRDARNKTCTPREIHT
ncbi:hypothetical protein [Shimia sp. SDUM112013]|uniref:hypothetical protein n=1 Tax=Shimia sp. SDUM112013 TaxID=3136160 RepID=UPI0032EECBD2